MGLTCLSRTLDLGDYVQLRSELHYAEEHHIPAEGGRRWEYALALHALGRWSEAFPLRKWVAPIYQIGRPEPQGPSLLHHATECDAQVVDPTQLAEMTGQRLSPLVVALSVIDAVRNDAEFLYYCSCLLAPGGLLVLTFPFWQRCGADTAVGHNDRFRIYCPKLYQALRAQAAEYLLSPFGGVDPTWHGPQVHDYTLASLVLEKRR
jgi:hypothetical protein